MGFTIKGHTKDIVIGLFWGIICLVVGFACVVGIEPSNVSIELQPFRITYLLATPVVLIFVAFSEEMIFRGYLLRKLLGICNKYVAIFISAAIFSLIHITNPGYDVFAFINIFIIGVFFALMYIYTNSLWFVVGIHFSWNLTQELLGLDTSEAGLPGVFNLNFTEVNLLNGGEYGFESSYICTIIVLLSAFLAIVYKKIRCFK
jgi:membrane protease YdiL (CAAX protease family)